MIRTVSDQPRIKDDPHGFGMAGLAPTHSFVRRVIEVTSDVTRLGGLHTFDLIIHSLKAPKTAACKNGDFLLS
jgi:hypothetical protein